MKEKEADRTSESSAKHAIVEGYLKYKFPIDKITLLMVLDFMTKHTCPDCSQRLCEDMSYLFQGMAFDIDAQGNIIVISLDGILGKFENGIKPKC